MAKSKEKKVKPKPPENAPTVIEMKKVIADRKAKLAKSKEAATKDGKFNKLDPKFRLSIKRLKRAQRKLVAEGVRLKPKKQKAVAVAVAVAAAPAAEAAPVAAPEAAPAPVAEAK